ncbi:MAG: Mut7-C RNAse domain-containing protein [Thermoplasmata archaeon]|nr:Mut7-C RNAse domain-containing protein [Thermoplasmata archaeon]
MDEPRWLADEMLGRLARYLRFLGHDTAYARGELDAAIAERARVEQRVLLTRDRALAARAPGALLLISPALDEQLRTVRRAYPQYRYALTFERCTLCNGRLAPAPAGDARGTLPGAPAARNGRALTVFLCDQCGHAYWEGSHTANIRTRVSEVFAVL